MAALALWVALAFEYMNLLQFQLNALFKQS